MGLLHYLKVFMKPKDFFNQHPVFTGQEYAQFLKQKKHSGERAQEALLSYHIKAGKLIRIRKGLFGVIPEGASAESYSFDPYLIAAKLDNEGVISYHSALAFYGKTYSVPHQFTIAGVKRQINFAFRENNFRLVLFPHSLRKKKQEYFGIKEITRRNCLLRVTSFERTLVDMLDRPELSISWEEIWRSLESVEYFDVDKIVEYALLLHKATTTALVGFYLEQHQHELKVKEFHLNQLLKYSLKQPYYIDRKNKAGNKFNKRWNLMIPIDLIEQSWKEW
jgi:predicted transcriptional regulator of viral defense system